MVGDVKQSIYKFRKARPELFLDKYKKFSNGISGIKIDLNKNFRSKKNILDCINFLFMQIMHKDFGGITYDNNSFLNYGANYMELPKKLNFTESIELDIIRTDEEDISDVDSDNISNINLESKFIAQKIYNIVNSKNKLYVIDKNTNEYRPVQYKDIVILSRSITSIGETLLTELNNYDIPAYVETDNAYFENLEVMIILNLLHIIDNPKQDIPLVSVLYSFLYNLTPDELVKIKNSTNCINFYDCILYYISEKSKDDEDFDIVIFEKLNKFIEDLTKWRSISLNASVSYLINIILNDTNFLNLVLAMPNGPVRQANLYILTEYALNYEKTNYKSLFSFIKYMEKLISKGIKLDNAKIRSGQDNVVRIMSIHKSKGLEFPVVFVSFLGRLFNQIDQKQSIVLHHDYGIGSKFIDLENRIRINTIPSIAISNKIKEEGLAEELRILYVALTRAKEKLFLTAYSNKIENKIQKWSYFINTKEIELPKQYLLKSRCFLDWIMPAFLRSKNAKNLLLNIGEISEADSINKTLFEFDFDLNINIVEREQLDNFTFDDDNQTLEFYNKKIEGFKNENLDSILNWEYPFKENISLPENLSITEIKKNYQKLDDNYQELITKNSFKMPSFLESKEDLTYAEKGTALHTVMQYLNLNIHETENDIYDLIESLKTKNLLSYKEAESIDINKVLNFINSDLGKRIKNSSYVKRETPFTMLISPEEAFLNVKSDSKILVHGIIDCYFEENDKIILVDYKSDNVTKNNINNIVERYKIQLSLYKKALERAEEKEVLESLIYLFSIDDIIKL